MEVEKQIAFLNGPKDTKYKKWAKGVDELYALMSESWIDDIEELTCYHYRIIIINRPYKVNFDFFPLSRKICNMKTKEWQQLSDSTSLKAFIINKTSL